jgi:hypothetical protein
LEQEPLRILLSVSFPTNSAFEEWSREDSPIFFYNEPESEDDSGFGSRERPARLRGFVKKSGV